LSWALAKHLNKSQVEYGIFNIHKTTLQLKSEII